MPINLPGRTKDEDNKMQNVRVINLGASQAPINFMDGLGLG
jgi:hypothetical protein